MPIETAFEIGLHRFADFYIKRGFFIGLSRKFVGMSNQSDELLDELPKVQLLVRLDKELHRWLRAEKRRSGRSLSWMVEACVQQWKERIEKGRKSNE
jgi:hypothetical protein